MTTLGRRSKGLEVSPNVDEEQGYPVQIPTTLLWEGMTQPLRSGHQGTYKTLFRQDRPPNVKEGVGNPLTIRDRPTKDGSEESGGTWTESGLDFVGVRLRQCVSQD